MKRSTTILISIIALALVVVALNTMGPEAEAQPQVAIAPHVVAVNQQVHLSVNQLLITRTWSDGLVEYARVTDPSGNISFTSWTEVPE